MFYHNVLTYCFRMLSLVVYLIMNTMKTFSLTNENRWHTMLRIATESMGSVRCLQEKCYLGHLSTMKPLATRVSWCFVEMHKLFDSRLCFVEYLPFKFFSVFASVFLVNLLQWNWINMICYETVLCYFCSL